MAGADHYNIYHDDFFDSGCRLNRDGSTSLCEELATNVVGTTYVHAAPDERQNYYWVVACNSRGCSEIDSTDPAEPLATSTTGSSVTPPTASRDLAFPEGESATRSILENTPAGINVGAPVSAKGYGTLGRWDWIGPVSSGKEKSVDFCVSAPRGEGRCALG